MIDIDRARLHCRVDHEDEDEIFLDLITEADEVIQNDLDRKIIANEADRRNDCDLLDNKWLDSARLIYIQYRYSRSLEGKPQAYLSLLQKFRIMGV